MIIVMKHYSKMDMERASWVLITIIKQHYDNNNNNNNAFYLKAPFKALKDIAHNNNSTTKDSTSTGQFSANK